MTGTRVSLIVAVAAAVVVAGGGVAVAGAQSGSGPIEPRNEIVASSKRRCISATWCFRLALGAWTANPRGTTTRFGQLIQGPITIRSG